MKLDLNQGGDGFDRRAIPASAVETRWTAQDGERIRRIDWLIPNGPLRGSLLFLPGRADCYEKYLETLDYWHYRGWRVTASDWRGQCGSGRLGADATCGHIDDYAVWIDDLAQLWEQWCSSTPAPHTLVCHSMGAHVALRALTEKRISPDAVVLIAPMLGLLPGLGFVPPGALRAIAGLMTGIGDPRRPVWKVKAQAGAMPAERMDRLTHDPLRFEDEAWWRLHRSELAMGAPSWGWIAATLASCAKLRRPGVLEAIDLPVLIMATSADKLVDYAAATRAAQRMARAQLVGFGAEARHELLREADPVRDRVLDVIDEFLDRHAPRID